MNIKDLMGVEKGKSCKACGYWTTDKRVCIWCGKKP